MKVIGLTGGIGSGKSTVATIFRVLGVPVFNSDKEAANLTKSKPIQQEIIAVFGKGILTVDSIDRKKLAAIVFNDKLKLEKLNAIIHPAVKSKFELWKSNQTVGFVVKEAAILIETGGHKVVDKVILVTCPEATRIKRVIKRDGVSVDQVKARIKNQLSEEEKIELADFVIKNDNNNLVIPQVLKIFNTLINENTNSSSVSGSR